MTSLSLKVVGGNNFGKFKKISSEQTYNMYISDTALIPYAGYAKKINVVENSINKEIYKSIRGNILIYVAGLEVFKIDQNFNKTFIGNIINDIGNIFISENNNAEITIVDGKHVYVYNYVLNTYKRSGVDFTVPFSNPIHICFHNGRLIVSDGGTQNWYLSDFNDATAWSFSGNSVGALQTKTDTIQAVIPIPSAGNNIFVIGKNVIEQWQDVGSPIFPYQRSSNSNIDFGVINNESIATLDTYIVWLSQNELSGITLMISNGSSVKTISTEGMNAVFRSLTNPQACSGFLFRLDGRMFYQFTFYEDNLSYVYDIQMNLFFTVTDENFDKHIARNVVFFNNSYYMGSFSDGNLYEMSTLIYNYDYGDGVIEQIPRVRICSPIRNEDSKPFKIYELSFPIENGEVNNSNLSECIDLKISVNGGESFGSPSRRFMNQIGQRKSRLVYNNLGFANDVTIYIQFIGFGRFIAFDGIIKIA